MVRSWLTVASARARASGFERAHSASSAARTASSTFFSRFSTASRSDARHVADGLPLLVHVSQGGPG